MPYPRRIELPTVRAEALAHERSHARVCIWRRRLLAGGLLPRREVHWQRPVPRVSARHIGQQVGRTDGPVRWTEDELRGFGTDEMRNRAQASGLRRRRFASPCSACLEAEAISVRKAARQIQPALPLARGRAWLRECLARPDGVHYGSTVLLWTRGRVVVQHGVPGDPVPLALSQIVLDFVIWRSCR